MQSLLRFAVHTLSSKDLCRMQIEADPIRIACSTILLHGRHRLILSNLITFYVKFIITMLHSFVILVCSHLIIQYFFSKVLLFAKSTSHSPHVIFVCLDFLTKILRLTDFWCIERVWHCRGMIGLRISCIRVRERLGF